MDPTTQGDVEMEGVEATPEEQAEENGGLDKIEPDQVPRPTFLDFLTSPIVQLIVGKGEERTILSAHEALLRGSPVLNDRCDSFKTGDSGAKRRIDLAEEDLSAVGSVLEFLYNGEYFPKRLAPDNKESPLEPDGTIQQPDNDGQGLLKHARIYTLAEKLGMPDLRSLAHSKIHSTSSTARGEIAYARYVYENTSREDTTIRKPVAAFWATRSHFLRHQAEEEFRTLCLEFPQFGFDVLNLVLDQREKKAGSSSAQVVLGESSAGAQATPASHGRKRQRHL